MTTRVYVGKVHADVRDRDIEKLFSNCGNVADVQLKNGFAFVQFKDVQDAEDAVRTLDGKDFFGERIVVELARGARRERENNYGLTRRTEHRLIVENLSTKVSWQDLKDVMRKAGEVTFVDCHKEREGEGVVEFQNENDKLEALRRLDDIELNGRRIILREARHDEKFSYHNDRRHPSDNNRYSDQRNRDRENDRHRNYDRDRAYDRDRDRRGRDRDYDRRDRYRDDDRDRTSRSVKLEGNDDGWDVRRTSEIKRVKHHDSAPYDDRTVKREMSPSPDRRSQSPGLSRR